MITLLNQLINNYIYNAWEFINKPLDTHFLSFTELWLNYCQTISTFLKIDIIIDS